MNPDLKERAKKVGIGVIEKPCRLCEGKGSIEIVDGLDLQRVRNKAEVSGYRVAKIAGKFPSYIAMVEQVDPDKEQRQCPDELLEIYIEIAEKGVPEEMKKKSGGNVALGHETGARNLRSANLLRPPVPKVKKGQVWERKDLAEGEEIPKRVEVIFVDGSTALVRRFDEPESIGKTIRTETLVQKWRDVTQEVKG